MIFRKSTYLAEEKYEVRPVVIKANVNKASFGKSLGAQPERRGSAGRICFMSSQRNAADGHLDARL